MRRLLLGGKKRDHPDIGDPVLEVRQNSHRDGLERQHPVGVDGLHLEKPVGKFQNPLGARQIGPFGLQNGDFALGGADFPLQRQQ